MSEQLSSTKHAQRRSGPATFIAWPLGAAPGEDACWTDKMKNIDLAELYLLIFILRPGRGGSRENAF